MEETGADKTNGKAEGYDVKSPLKKQKQGMDAPPRHSCSKTPLERGLGALSWCCAGPTSGFQVRIGGTSDLGRTATSGPSRPPGPKLLQPSRDIGVKQQGHSAGCFKTFPGRTLPDPAEALRRTPLPTGPTAPVPARIPGRLPSALGALPSPPHQANFPAFSVSPLPAPHTALRLPRRPWS
jgi:hypothetical protein